jgi:hypothetical protein
MDKNSGRMLKETVIYFKALLWISPGKEMNEKTAILRPEFEPATLRKNLRSLLMLC